MRSEVGGETPGGVGVEVASRGCRQGAAGVGPPPPFGGVRWLERIRRHDTSRGNLSGGQRAQRAARCRSAAPPCLLDRWSGGPPLQTPRPPFGGCRVPNRSRPHPPAFRPSASSRPRVSRAGLPGAAGGGGGEPVAVRGQVRSRTRLPARRSTDADRLRPEIFAAHRPRRREGSSPTRLSVIRVGRPTRFARELPILQNVSGRAGPRHSITPRTLSHRFHSNAKRTIT